MHTLKISKASYLPSCSTNQLASKLATKCN